MSALMNRITKMRDSLVVRFVALVLFYIVAICSLLWIAGTSYWLFEMPTTYQSF